MFSVRERGRGHGVEEGICVRVGGWGGGGAHRDPSKDVERRAFDKQTKGALPGISREPDPSDTKPESKPHASATNTHKSTTAANKNKIKQSRTHPTHSAHQAKTLRRASRKTRGKDDRPLYFAATKTRLYRSALEEVAELVRLDSLVDSTVLEHS